MNNKENQNSYINHKYPITSRKKEITDEEYMILSKPQNIKEEDSLNDENSKRNISNNISEEDNMHFNNLKYKRKYILKTSEKLNTSSSTMNKTHFNKTTHYSITSKNKKPNLIKNVQYKSTEIKKRGKINYHPLTSFEAKLIKELGRISDKYSSSNSIKFFTTQLPNTDLYWGYSPNYELYRQLKEMETRSQLQNCFTKPRLKPLICRSKDGLTKLAKRLYEIDQANKYKEFLKNQCNKKGFVSE